MVTKLSASPIILASKSPFRAALLKNAGIQFTTESADIDERKLEEPLYAAGADATEVALVLAEAKAQAVSKKIEIFGGIFRLCCHWL